MQRRTGELLWRIEAARDALSLAVGGNKVFCAELTDPKRGEDETRDGSMFALNIATGDRVWQRAGGARLRYSPSLDIVVTPTGFYRGSDGEPLSPEFRFAADATRRPGKRVAQTGTAGITSPAASCSPATKKHLRRLRHSIGRCRRRTAEMGPPRMHRHAGEYASADHALLRQFGLDRSRQPRDHAAAGSPSGLLGEQQPVPGQRRAEHPESHGRLCLQLRARLDGLRAGRRCRTWRRGMNGCLRPRRTVDVKGPAQGRRAEKVGRPSGWLHIEDPPPARRAHCHWVAR